MGWIKNWRVRRRLAAVRGKWAALDICLRKLDSCARGREFTIDEEESWDDIMVQKGWLLVERKAAGFISGLSEVTCDIYGKTPRWYVERALAADRRSIERAKNHPTGICSCGLMLYANVSRSGKQDGVSHLYGEDEDHHNAYWGASCDTLEDAIDRVNRASDGN